MKVSLSILWIAAVTSRVAAEPTSPERTRLQAISPELGPMLDSFGAEIPHPSVYDRVKRGGGVTKLSPVEPEITRLAEISPDLLESFGPDFDQLPENERVKRAGNIFSFIGNKLSSGISSIAQASSGIKSKFNSAGGGGHEYGPPVESYGHKSFDIWSFKKAILHTLLQAVKAINGGIIAINGQLIKGTGYVVETKGRILQQKGEKIYEFGKGVAHSALLSPAKTQGFWSSSPPKEAAHPPPPPPPPSAPAHLEAGPSPQADYGTPSGAGYDGHSGYSEDYNVPSAPLPLGYDGFGGSAPGPEYGAPHYQLARAVTPAPAPTHKQREDKQFDEKDVKAGLLVLKPIPDYGAKAQSFGRSLANNAYQEPGNDYQSFKRQAPAPSYQTSNQQAGYSNFQSQKLPATPNSYRAAKQQAAGYSNYPSRKRQAPPPGASSYQSSSSSALYRAPSNKYSVYAAPPPSVFSQPATAYSSRSYSALPPPSPIYRPYRLEQMPYDPSLGYSLPSIEYE